MPEPAPRRTPAIHVPLLAGQSWPLAALLLPLAALALLIFLSYRPPALPPPPSPAPPPTLAYFLSGTAGDGARLRRLLLALYHPTNCYLLHLDAAAAPRERAELAEAIRRFANVRVAASGDLAAAKGPTAVAASLHAAAVLLREFPGWTWFVNLDASDYPLMPQDDILHVFSYLPKDLNFVEHTSDIGWREYQRARPIIVDRALHTTNESSLFWIAVQRGMPSAFKIFMGSSRVVLNRLFLQFCVVGWDNLPRTLLLYFTNILASSESYFQTVICNSQGFQNTTVNHDLRFVAWDTPPHEDPKNLTAEHFAMMAVSGAPFARSFSRDDPVLDRIDSELLGKHKDGVTPGGWCMDCHPDQPVDEHCALHQDRTVLRPTERSRKLQELMSVLLDEQNFRPKQCK